MEPRVSSRLSAISGKKSLCWCARNGYHCTCCQDTSSETATEKETVASSNATSQELYVIVKPSIRQPKSSPRKLSVTGGELPLKRKLAADDATLHSQPELKSKAQEGCRANRLVSILKTNGQRHAAMRNQESFVKNVPENVQEVGKAVPRGSPLRSKVQQHGSKGHMVSILKRNVQDSGTMGHNRDAHEERSSSMLSQAWSGGAQKAAKTLSLEHMSSCYVDLSASKVNAKQVKKVQPPESTKEDDVVEMMLRYHRDYWAEKADSEAARNVETASSKQVFSIAAALVNDNIELGADVCEQLPESCEVRVARQRGKTVLLGNLPALLQAEALLKYLVKQSERCDEAKASRSTKKSQIVVEAEEDIKSEDGDVCGENDDVADEILDISLLMEVKDAGSVTEEVLNDSTKEKYGKEKDDGYKENDDDEKVAEKADERKDDETTVVLSGTPQEEEDKRMTETAKMPDALEDGNSGKTSSPSVGTTSKAGISELPREFQAIHKCDLCEYVGTDYGLQTHRRRYHGYPRYPCDLCDQRFVLRSDFVNHRKRHYNKDGTINPVVNRYLPKKPRTTGVPKIHMHGSVKCKQCGFTTTTSGLRRHMKRYHGDPKDSYTCTVCHKTFGYKVDGVAHYKRHFDEKGELKVRRKKGQIVKDSDSPHSCEQCSRAFRSKRALTYHKKTLHGRDPWVVHCNNVHKPSAADEERLSKLFKTYPKCSHCCYRAPKRRLHSHVWNMHWRRLLYCAVCETAGPTRAWLKKHMARWHSGDNKAKSAPAKTKDLRRKTWRLCWKKRNLHKDDAKHAKGDKSAKSDSECGDLPPVPDIKLPVQYQRIHKCDKCDFVSTKTGLEHHKRRHHRPANFLCDICHQSFVRSCDMVGHRKQHFNEDGTMKPLSYKSKERLKALQDGTDTETDSKRHQICPTCGKKCRAGRMNTHFKRYHAEKKFVCSICRKAFGWKADYKQHVKSHYDKNGKIKQWVRIAGGVGLDEGEIVNMHQCHLCDKTYQKRNGLRMHMKHRHSESSAVTPRAICEYCSFEAKHPYEIELHIARRHREKTHHCQQCTKSFATDSLLQAHIKIFHLKEQVVSCPLCGKEFIEKRYLKAHMDRHMNNYKYHCDICGKGFIERWRVEEHKDIHKPLAERGNTRCAVCGQQFTSAKYLKYHMNLHAKSKDTYRYKCDHCEKAFALPQSLSKHKRKHAGEQKSYHCSYCGRHFSSETSLKNHELTHTGKCEHVCQACGKMFALATTLHRHNCKGRMVSLLPTTEDSVPHTQTETEGHAVENHGDPIIVIPAQPQETVTLESDVQEVTSSHFQSQINELVSAAETQFIVKHEGEQQMEGTTIGILEGGTDLSVLSDVGITTLDMKTEESLPEVYLCSLCEKLLPTWEAIQQHMLEHTSNEQSELIVAASEADGATAQETGHKVLM